MTTQQLDATAMTDQELDQVSAGLYAPGYDGPDRGPLTLWPLIVLVAVGAGVLWGAGKVLDGLDEVQDAADGSKKRSCK